MSTDLKIVIRTKDQRANLIHAGKILKTYQISTAAKGLGSEINSFKTPTGLFRIAKKIGEGCEVGTIFRARVPSGEIWNSKVTSDDDLVLSRILWLEGCEPHNANTIDRYIYLHGTNQEDLLGQAVSHGCVRLSNEDIIELFDLVPEGTEVEILG